MIHAVFKTNMMHKITHSVYQWNYGEVLYIHDLPLPENAFAHFSADWISDTLLVPINIVSNNLATVNIPDELFVGFDDCRNYSICVYIYIEEEKIGIRIENDVLVTKDGYIDLASDIIYNHGKVI